jgi:hypothetical protein
MTAIVFVGPSLDISIAKEHIDAIFLPPAKMGDVYRAASRKPTMIGIIDGLFEQTPAVWHKEVLYAMNQGIPVFGGASMGALRAAELHVFGMKGVGRIFEDFASGVLEDDDEVAVVHATGGESYNCQSEAMVNIRYGLESACNVNVLTSDECSRLIRFAKNQFYPDRSWYAILEEARRIDVPQTRLKELSHYLTEPETAPNQKRDDAIALLRAMENWRVSGQSQGAVNFDFEHTTYWERVETYFSAAPSGAPSTDTFVSRVCNHVRAIELDREQLLERSLLLSLISKEASNVGVSEPNNQIALTRFRSKRSLNTPEQLASWMTANAVSKNECLRLARLEYLIPEVAKRRVKQVDQHMLLALKLADRYAMVVDHITNKWGAFHVSESRSLLSSESDTIRAALDWYELRFGASIVGDLKEHSLEWGFETPREFIEELLAEYQYGAFQGSEALPENTQ